MMIPFRNPLSQSHEIDFPYSPVWMPCCYLDPIAPHPGLPLRQHTQVIQDLAKDCLF